MGSEGGELGPVALPSYPKVSDSELAELLAELSRSASEEEIRERLVERTLWIAAEVAEARSGQRLQADDLFQEAAAALLVVVHGIDAANPMTAPELVESVRTAARGAVEASLAEEEQARLADERWARDAERLFLAMAELERESGSPPSEIELAAHLDWEVERVEQLTAAVAEASAQHDLELLEAIGEAEDD